MRNGIRFSKLTLVEGDSQDNDGPAAYFPYRPDSDEATSTDNPAKNLLLVMLTLSITCAAVTVVTGSYAVWLARQQAAHQALTDVNDILRSCQARMSRLESDLQRLPKRHSRASQ